MSIDSNAMKRLFYVLCWWPLLCVNTGKAQSASTPDSTVEARTIQVPVPTEGILYYRRGTPGGVRIRSRNGQPPPGYVPRPDPAQVELEGAMGALADSVLRSWVQPVAPAQGRNTWEEELARFEARLLRRIDEQMGVASPVQDTEDVDAFNPASPALLIGRTPAVRDSLQASGTAAVAVDDTTATTLSPRVEYIERMLLETGLFQAVDVLFETGQSTLLSFSEETLNKMGDVLTNYPSLALVIEGHTDSIGVDDFNQTLSEARAASVRTYLLTNFPAVDPERLTTQGFGETQPVAPNTMETGRALNRRVVFRVRNPGSIERTIPEQ